MECTHPPNDGTADNAKLITHRLGLQSTVNVDYDLPISHPLGITQSVLGIAFGNVAQSLGITQTVAHQHAVPYPVAHSLGITHTVVHAGSFGSGGVPPCTAIFDSDAVSGQPVYVASDTNVGLTDSVANCNAIGLAFSDISASEAGQYITEGTITKLDWTAVVGTVLLTPGAVYYLGSVGKLTSTPPTTAGQHVVAVARAASNTKLNIEIAEPILL